MRKKYIIKFLNDEKSLQDWAKDERCKVKYATLRDRVKNGWQFEKALTTPAVQMLIAFGENKSVKDWAKDKRCNVSDQTLYNRLKKAWNAEKAITTPHLPKKLTAFGETKSIDEWLKDYRCEVSHNTLRKRLSHGYDLETALKGKEELSGREFQDFIVISKANHRTWLCKCKFCGRNRKLCTKQVLSDSFCRKCKCRPHLDPMDVSKRTIYRAMRLKALCRNIEFDLTIQEFVELTSARCVYCGHEPSQRWSNSKDTRKGLYVYNGIDRVDNKKDYTLDNCVSCCKRCNSSKLDDDLKSFLIRIHNIYDKIFLNNDFGSLVGSNIEEIVNKILKNHADISFQE